MENRKEKVRFTNGEVNRFLFPKIAVENNKKNKAYDTKNCQSFSYFHSYGFFLQFND